MNFKNLIIIAFLFSFFPFYQIKADKCTIDVEIVFIVDTSGSMNNERQTLCNVLDEVVQALKAQDVNLTYKIYALRNLTDLYQPQPKPCETDYIDYNVCGGNDSGDNEHWGPATEWVANNYPWSKPIKIIMPISDEGPYCGDDCDANDASSISSAITAANNHGIYIFPFLGDKGDVTCASTSMANLVAGTTANDQVFTWSGNNPDDMANAIYTAVMMAAFDGDGDHYMTLECPCDPENPPRGMIGCYDCNDANRNEVHCCFCGGIVPCGRKVDCPSDCPNGTLIDERTPCNLCHLLVLLKKLVDFTLTFILFPLAILMIAIGSLFIMTAGGDPEKVAQGKKMIMTVLIGVAIALGGWLVVDTIITFLTPASSPLQHWSQITC